MRMPRSLVRLAGVFLLIVIVTGIFWFQPLRSFFSNSVGKSARSAHAAPALPFHQYADGPYKVQGNSILGADGQPYLFHGIGRDGLEFSCGGGGYLDSAHLAYMGPKANNPQTGTYWYANTVRLPLAQNFWFNGQLNQCTAAQYQATVKQTVDALTALKLNVMIDLQWSDANAQASGGAGWQMPDAGSVTFWQQVAAIYAGYSNVLFELYNEPHPVTNTTPQAYDWQCWQSGCQITNDSSYVSACNCMQTFSYTAVGMQALVNAVRGAGANNLVLVAGVDWGFDLSKIGTYTITGSNVVYDTHPYPYSEKMPSFWDAAFGTISATYPVMSAESGEYDCKSSYMSQLYSYFDAHSIGWVSWAWFALPNANTGAQCGYPQLITDYQGTPLAGMGQFIYAYLLSYAGVAVMPVSQVNSTWYFSEGRVGAGFKEFLTMENPGSALCAVTIQYLTQPDHGPGLVKTVSVNVPPQTRYTENVNSDLGSSPTGPGISDSAILTVDTTATPNCAGIVAERPMYFNALGTSSGSDVVGMTHLGTTFYFGDLASGGQPGGGNYSSFIAILNPPGGQVATVTANYYANGVQVGTQQVVVNPGARGTISPGAASPRLPARVAVSITSTQPVAVERPTYFSGINGGTAGTVSGAADVIGVQSLSNDWLFAEGYTGGQFQENFAIANLDPANKIANVTITLELPTGSTSQFQVNVNPFSQVIWNVNNAVRGQSVSAEISSTGAQIVAEREMFFHYNHAANGRTLTANGGTDVLGQVGPAAYNTYSFAEGYTNIGYDEWLTIQNPTTNPEFMSIGIVNGKGTVYVASVNVAAHSRMTLDVTGIILRYVYHQNDGYPGFEVSMVVQSLDGPFVAERPMYFNSGGQQGGTDVIGYVGG